MAYNLEVKKRVLKHVRMGITPVEQIAQIRRIPKQTIYRWISLFGRFGESGLENRPPGARAFQVNGAFEGMVLGIKGRGNEKTFVVRRIGAQRIGIERIFPVSSPSIAAVEVVRSGLEGSRHAKLYFTRTKSKKDVESIYSRTNKRTRVK